MAISLVQQDSQLAVTLPEMDRRRVANTHRCAACRALMPRGLVRECPAVYAQRDGHPPWWVCRDAEACRARSGDLVPL